jgi:integrase
MPRRVHEALAPVSIKAKPPGMYADGGGLYLRVTSGSEGRLWRSWAFRYMIGGRAREMGLGPYPDISVKHARQLAAEARALAREGRDPIQARQARRQMSLARGVTFEAAAEDYITHHAGKWKNAKTGDQWRASLRDYAYPVFGPMSVADIGLGEVERVLRPIWEGKPETARRVRSRVENILDYATARGLREGDNPARWRGGPLKELLAAKPRTIVNHPALPYRELPEFIRLLRAREGNSARALELIILTATRTREAVLARWEEFDLAEAVWKVPAERMKSGRSHRVPLPPAAISLLTAQRKRTKGDLVFPREGTKNEPMSANALLALLKRMDRSDITVHGFRSTFRDWAADNTNFPREVQERALAHAPRDRSEAAYQRSDMLVRRRPLMVAWAAFIESKPPASNDDEAPDADARAQNQ